MSLTDDESVEMATGQPPSMASQEITRRINKNWQESEWPVASDCTEGMKARI